MQRLIKKNSQHEKPKILNITIMKAKKSSSGPRSQVRVQEVKFGSKKSSSGPRSQVRVQEAKFGSKKPSSGPRSQVRLQEAKFGSKKPRSWGKQIMVTLNCKINYDLDPISMNVSDDSVPVFKLSALTG